MAESWPEIEALFQRVADLAPAERAAILDRDCAERPELRRQVESLLAADLSAGSFLDPPTLDAKTQAAHGALVGGTVGRFRILRRLGQGGMAVVYLAARDRDYRQQVAIKVFGHDRRRQDLLKRFEHERQILAGLEHPYIARLIDGGSTPDGLPFLAMELIEGEPIDLYCDRLKLPIEPRIDLFLRLCEAVSYAHRRLVVHRDLKPRNVLVRDDGTPKLLDFGIAKLLADDPDAFKTKADHRLMTPAYASPEQIRGEAITTSSDVYSLGVLLHLLLAGSHPPGDLGRQLPADLETIVLTALREDAGERYGSVDELALDLRRYLRGLPINARPATFAYTAKKFVRRHRLAVAAGVAFVVLVLSFATFALLLARQVTIERDQARSERDKARHVALFFKEIFQEAHPDRAKGEQVTAQEILERGAERLDTELEDQPEIYATLANTIGDVYTELGLDGHAEPLLDRALEIAREQLSPDHPTYGDTLHQQGKLWLFRGDLPRAEAALRQALGIRRAQGGEPLLETLNLLGVTLGMQGEYDACEPLLREALERRRELFDGETIEEAILLNNLGMLNDSRGDLRAAEAYYREALAVSGRVDPNHSNRVATYLNLGILQLEWGDLAAAEESYREAHRVARVIVGDDHWQTMMAIAGQGSVASARGDAEAAERLLETAALGLRRQLGDDHPRVADLTARQGLSLLRSGQPRAARQRLEAALELRRRRLGERHPFHARNLLLIARAHLAEGAAQDAERLSRQALDLLRDALGENHYQVAEAQVDLGASLLAQGRAEEAYPLLLGGLEGQLQALPETAPQISRAQGELGACLASLGRFDEAEPLLLKGPRTLASSPSRFDR